MSNAERKNKHMTLEERQRIQECLDCGMDFKSIGRRIGKDQTTISKEVKKHITVENRSESAAQTGPCPLLLHVRFIN